MVVSAVPLGARRALAAREADEIGEAAAQAELARLWLAAFGPAPLADLKWWTGWTMTQARRAVAEIGAVEVILDGGTGLALPDDLEQHR